MHLCVFLLLCTFVRNVRCFYMPVCGEAGQALENIINYIRGLVPAAFEYFEPRPKPVRIKSYLEEISEYFGFVEAPEPEEDLNSETFFLYNRFVILTIVSCVFGYIMFAKKYFVTVPTPQAEFFSFASEDEGDESDLESAVLLTRTCQRCACENFIIDDRGDIT